VQFFHTLLALSGSAKYKLLKVREKKCFVLLQYFNRNSLASHNNQIQLADKIAKRKQLTIQGNNHPINLHLY
jgi:hypothetical protein